MTATSNGYRCSFCGFTHLSLKTVWSHEARHYGLIQEDYWEYAKLLSQTKTGTPNPQLTIFEKQHGLPLSPLTRKED